MLRAVPPVASAVEQCFGPLGGQLNNFLLLLSQLLQAVKCDQSLAIDSVTAVLQNDRRSSQTTFGVEVQVRSQRRPTSVAIGLSALIRTYSSFFTSPFSVFWQFFSVFSPFLQNLQRFQPKKRFSPCLYSRIFDHFDQNPGNPEIGIIEHFRRNRASTTIVSFSRFVRVLGPKLLQRA